MYVVLLVVVYVNPVLQYDDADANDDVVDVADDVVSRRMRD